MDDLAAHDGKQVECTGLMPCPNGVFDRFDEENKCSWTRKLCVSCFEEADGTVKIKVQSNGMPNHCFSSKVDNFATPEEIEWQVVFNPDVSDILNYEAYDFNSQVKTTEILCDI